MGLAPLAGRLPPDVGWRGEMFMSDLGFGAVAGRPASCRAPVVTADCRFAVAAPALSRQIADAGLIPA